MLGLRDRLPPADYVVNGKYVRRLVRLMGHGLIPNRACIYLVRGLRVRDALSRPAA